MTESLGLLLSYPGQVIKRYLAREKFTRIFTIVVLLVIILSVALAIYSITFSGLNFISRENDFQGSLYFYITQLFCLLVFSLSYGNSILVLASSFARKSHQWIVVTPSFSILAFINLFQLLISTLWIFLAVITPVLLAINQFMGLGWEKFMLSFILTTALIIIAIVCGVFSYMLSIYFLRYISKLLGTNIASQSSAVLLLSLSSILMILFFWRVAVPTDFVRFFDGNAVMQMKTMQQQLVYLPTFGVGQVLYDILFCANISGAFYVGIFTGIAIGLMVILYALLQRNYLTMWQTLQEGRYVAGSEKMERFSYKSYTFPSDSAIHTIIDKEILLIWRDKKNVLWFLIVFGLWLAQTGVSWRVMQNSAAYGAVEKTPNFIFAIVLAIGLYFISALALRFVFPTFSTERKVAWILGVAPISLWNIAVGKLIIYTALFWFLGSPILLANLIILGLGTFPIMLYWLVFGLSILLIVLLAIFLSVRYPNRFSSDPESLSTTLPGLAFTSLALGGSIIISNIMYLVLSNVDLVVLLVLLITTLNSLLVSMIHSASEKFEYAGEIIA
ncbi:MAG: putative ATP-binding cassette [Candidatus Parcubacteria bacterium]|jgi:hypothetical protein